MTETETLKTNNPKKLKINRRSTPMIRLSLREKEERTRRYPMTTHTHQAPTHKKFKATTDTQTPKLFHKEATPLPQPDGQTRCGLTMDNALGIINPTQDMAKMGINPHMLAMNRVPCLKCMSQKEKAQIMDWILDDPDTRTEALRAMDCTSPGNIYVKMGLDYQTNNEFRKGLDNHIFNKLKN